MMHSAGQKRNEDSSDVYLGRGKDTHQKEGHSSDEEEYWECQVCMEPIAKSIMQVGPLSLACVCGLHPQQLDDNSWHLLASYRCSATASAQDPPRGVVLVSLSAVLTR